MFLLSGFIPLIAQSTSMNTFLPSPDFAQCARILDLQRLNRQISECSWVASALGDKPNSSISRRGLHPVFKLWIDADTKQPLLGHLRQYQLALTRAWNEVSKIRTGKYHWHAAAIACRWMDYEPCEGIITWPKEVHISHCAALYRKDPNYYGLMLQAEGLTILNGEGYAWLSPTILPVGVK